MLIIPFFEMATFAILLRFISFFFFFLPFLELVTIDETFEKIREGDPRSLEQLFVRDELRKNEEEDLFVRIIIIR